MKKLSVKILLVAALLVSGSATTLGLAVGNPTVTGVAVPKPGFLVPCATLLGAEREITVELAERGCLEQHGAPTKPYLRPCPNGATLFKMNGWIGAVGQQMRWGQISTVISGKRVTVEQVLDELCPVY